jgi:outer membrane lipoprotein-sorting protein
MRLLVTIALSVTCCLAQTPPGNDILKRVDENMGSDTKVSIGQMRVQERRESRTVKMKSWLRGMKDSFTEFLEPPREKGTKMLKLDNQLWTYTPSTDRTILISGHMLRQSVMGSDLSYQDLLEDPKLQPMYEATVIGEENVLERPCWVLSLASKGSDVAYHSRKIWVDRERFLVMKEDRFARSGKLLKTTVVKKVVEVNGKWVSSEIVVKDALKSGGGTEFVVEDVQFNVAIPDYFFTKAALRK